MSNNLERKKQVLIHFCSKLSSKLQACCFKCWLLPPSCAHMAVMAKLNYSFDSAECGLCMIPIIILLDLSNAHVGNCFENLC